ncbi:hypothetical protein AVEN_222689-1 [Araneus ventricosus]|uniref:Uncharacterized protein n=1 Tax=Araneus ventricosus TaxID=182803 RepID=A0A4Y2AZJ7_ARAVE|nr:hypothetical protein AVEN_222689-1 [Araneus ventricosus]
MEAPDCEVEDVSQHENHTIGTSDYDENIVTQTIHNVQHIQYKHQNINWSLDQPPRSAYLNFANFMKTALSVTRVLLKKETLWREGIVNITSLLPSVSYPVL